MATNTSNMVSILKEIYSDDSPDRIACMEGINAFWNIMKGLEETYPRKDDEYEVRVGVFADLVYKSNPFLNLVKKDMLQGKYIPVPIEYKK